jgi:hypothetical protein
VLDDWIAALETRHLANLKRSEVTRALRALSSCYVERRDKLQSGAALEGAGKRAAFALFYGPLHFLTITGILKASGLAAADLDAICDLGCGTGVGGAAWAVTSPAPLEILGFDRSAWAVDEANWTYRTFGLRGRATRADISRVRLDATALRHPPARTAILLGYAVNELSDDGRDALLRIVRDATDEGAPLLIVEPIGTRLGHARWWEAWRQALAPAGVREDEWRFPATLPDTIRELASGAGLRPRELTARTLSTRPEGQA